MHVLLFPPNIKCERFEGDIHGLLSWYGHKHAKVSQLVILAQKLKVGENYILNFRPFINVIKIGVY
jgi:hypothetical protein